MLKNKKAGLFTSIFPVFFIFVIGTIIILTFGFFILNWFSANITTHSIIGLNSVLKDCRNINAGVIGLVIISLVIFQGFFYTKYRKHKHGKLK